MLLGACSCAFNSGRFHEFLEQFKETMREGDTNLGIPSLDPYEYDHVDIEEEERELFSADGYLKKLRIKGLSDYKVKQADFTMVGLKANVVLLFRKIEIWTRYNMSGTLLDDISFEGRGISSLCIKKLEVTVDLQLEVNEGGLRVSNLECQTEIQKLDCSISELYVDEELCEDVSEIISDEAPDFLEDHQYLISRYLNRHVRNVINDILKQYTLKNIFAMISG